MTTKLILAFALFASSLAIQGCVGCDPTYSDGDRAGRVVKLSQKGVLLKSWEGSMTVSGAGQGLAVSEFNFSTRDANVARDLQGALQSAKPVVLHYRQWLLAPSSIDDDHEVMSVEQSQAVQ